MHACVRACVRVRAYVAFSKAITLCAMWIYKCGSTNVDLQMWIYDDINVDVDFDVDVSLIMGH